MYFILFLKAPDIGQVYRALQVHLLEGDNYCLHLYIRIDKSLK